MVVLWQAAIDAVKQQLLDVRFWSVAGIFAHLGAMTALGYHADIRQSVSGQKVPKI